jgi:ATP-dependent protease Clp ATPase subunit
VESGRKKPGDALRCSFCHKSQDVVGKLISSPSDYPRAYICDECVMVCCSILQDDKVAATPREPHHPAYALLEQLRPEELDALTYLIEVMLRRASRNTANSG